MIQSIRDKYLNSRTQIVVLDREGRVLESEDHLFYLEPGTHPEEFHPFFSILHGLIEMPEEETAFSGVHIDVGREHKVVDIIINSGSESQLPFIVLVDFSFYYKNFQSIAQEKNESILSFHLEELKNRQLLQEKEFKDKFLANVSHDLKTPIWGTGYFIERLFKTPLSETQRDYADMIKTSNDHIYRLVEDLLDLSRIEFGQIVIEKQPFQLHELLHELELVYTAKCEEKGLAFDVIIANNVPETIESDHHRLRQVLINIVDNAVKFTDSGRITVEVAATDVVMFRVSDTGRGIETQHKDAVYKSFSKLHDSKKIEGLGLGLAIVSKLLHLLNGTVDFTSEVGKGTVFTVTIPLK